MPFKEDVLYGWNIISGSFIIDNEDNEAIRRIINGPFPEIHRYFERLAEYSASFLLRKHPGLWRLVILKTH